MDCLVEFFIVEAVRLQSTYIATGILGDRNWNRKRQGDRQTGRQGYWRMEARRLGD